MSYALLQVLLALSAPGAPFQSPIPKASPMIYEGWGLQRVDFQTAQGIVSVVVPAERGAGDSISGTVIADPAGRTTDERLKNADVLSGMVVECPQTALRSGMGGFKMTLPGAASAAPLKLVLKNASGAVVAQKALPNGAIATPRSSFRLPECGQSLRPILITGPFDGDAASTTITIGGQPASILAESPTCSVAVAPQGQGPASIELKESGQTVTGPFRTLTISLSAAKTTLLKGEKTQLTVTVSGLGERPSEVPIVLECLTPQTTTLEGGANQVLLIRLGAAKNGVVQLHRTMTGIRPGTFTVSALISPHIFFGLTWHDIKVGLNAEEFKDFLAGIISALEKKAADPNTNKDLKGATEGTIEKLKAASALAGTVIPGLEVAKDNADNALATLGAIEMAQKLISAGSGATNPFDRNAWLRAIKILKFFVFAWIQVENDQKKKDEMVQKVRELSALERQEDAAKSDEEKKTLRDKIDAKIKEIGDTMGK